MRPNKLSASNSEREFWMLSAEKTTSLFNNLEIDYVVINYLDIPYTNMRDLDILVEKNEDRAKLVSFLKKEGYIADRYSAISFFSDYKSTYTAPETGLEVDIYPKLAWSWWKIPYSPVGLISSRKMKVPFGKGYTYVPSHTLDLYTTVAHSHAHSKISLAEVGYITKLLLKYNEVINWYYMLFLVERYGLEHTLYLHLLLANTVLKILNKNYPNLQNVIDALSTRYMCRLLVKNLQKANSNHFPLQYPNITRFLSVPNEHLSLRLQSKILSENLNCARYRTILNA